MRSIIAAFVLGFWPPAAVTAAEPATRAPDWFRSEIAQLSAEGGRWIADNAAYRSENEPFEAYGTEWISGFDGDTMRGRLFGVKDGNETAFDFWEFRQYWHPGRKEGIVEQFGWSGALGAGSITQDDGGTKSEQVFYNPDGSVTRTGHIAKFTDANTYVTESFDIIGDEWRPRRTYVWKRQPKADKSQ